MARKTRRAILKDTMPTEGLTRMRSPRNGQSGRKAAPARVEREASHRVTDMLGIGFLGLAALLVVALLLGNGGVFGDSLAGFVRMLFGRGAWAVPFVFCLVGFSLIGGRSAVSAGRLSWGAFLIFFGTLAIFAESRAGDFFDPEIVTSSGGYVGAVAGWALEGLLGAGKLIGVVVLICLGAILCLDAPIRTILANAKDRVKAPKIRKLPEESAPSAVGKSRDEQRRAAVKMLQTKLADEDVEEETSVPEPKGATRRPRFNTQTPEVTKAPEPRTFSLDTTSNDREGYTLPPISLLAEPSAKAKRSPQEVQRNIEILENTLEQFNIDANVVEVANGPTITRYEVQLGPGIRVNRITALADNLAMNLAASHVRVEAPIPGKSAIGVEVPTATRSMVTLREMCDTLEFHDVGNKLTVALGKDVSGVNKYTDLTRMPHVLIGGATNSGKSICLSTLIMSLIMRMTPKDLRLVMIDPKRVELTLFEGLPHLMCPVVKDVKEAPGVLRAVVREMDRRYDKFSEAAVRNIDGWNAKASFQDRLPYIVVIVDELADMMIQAAAEVETSICRLAQLARATGIHLVIATQRPSVDVITGTIKNNISSRVAFAVSSQIDSRTILDQAGAEKLIGKGDMLFLPIDATKPTRIQGCYVSEKEIEDVCTFWRNQAKPDYILNPIQIAIEDREADMREEEESDPLWDEAIRWVVDRGQASTSMLQRKFSIGFQRASRLLDLMEERGIVGPRDGPRPREVLMDPMQLEARYGGDKYMTPMSEDDYIEDD